MSFSARRTKRRRVSAGKRTRMSPWTSRPAAPWRAARRRRPTLRTCTPSRNASTSRRCCRLRRSGGSAAAPATGRLVGPEERIEHLLEEIQLADTSGLHSFGIGEHHREEYYDSAPPVILGAAAARTSRIRLGSAVTVLSAADPVRVFQQFATLDLISKGRIDLVVGRGSFTEAFPLFGLSLADYDSLFEEKLDLLLRIRESEHVTWSGRHRPPLNGQGVYPRPLQDPLPIWVGVGGTPESFVRAGLLGLPLMVAIIGGQPRQFGPLIDLYRRAGAQAGHAPDTLQVGLHVFGFVAGSTE